MSSRTARSFLRGRLAAMATSILGLVVGAATLVGCVPPDATDGQVIDEIDQQTGAIKVDYRGESRLASRNSDGHLVLEGDILVTPEDQWRVSMADKEGSVAVKKNSLRIQGRSYMWPRDAAGIVQIPYEFVTADINNDGVADSFAATQRTAILDAMAHITALVPNINFRMRAATESQRIIFTPSAGSCSSPVGAQPSGNTVYLASSCTEFRVHHEIMHSLGLRHEQSRSDRGSWVTINWKNIRGCRSTATSIADCGPTACSGNLADCGCTQALVIAETCYMAHNFDVPTDSAIIGAYDYDSLMHYETTAFAKSGTTLTATQSINGLTLGQRTHLSERDIMALRVMYPMQWQQSSAFADTGLIHLCDLAGREADIAVQHTLTPSHANFAANGTFRTNGIAPGEYTFKCTTRSSYWASNFPYPNSTVAYDSRLSLETYTGPQFKLTLMNPGLLALLGP